MSNGQPQLTRRVVEFEGQESFPGLAWRGTVGGGHRGSIILYGYDTRLSQRTTNQDFKN